jgi:surface antigen
MALAFAVMMTTLCGAGQAFAQPFDTLDEPEQLAMADTLQYALENNPSNEVSNWVNPDTGRSGAVVPMKTYTSEAGLPCREFITTIVIGGKEEQGYGTACRQPDGSWQIMTDEQDTVAPAPTTNVYVYSPPERHYYVYPGMYYYYPSSFYYPYNIFLSFSYIYRSGHLHYGAYYLDGRSFRHRHPVHVRSRIYVGPRIFSHHRWFYRPPVHYRHVVRPPVHRERYEYRTRDAARPINRERYDYRQQQFQRDRNRQVQVHRSQPAVNNFERQRQFQRDADRNRQVHRSQPAVNVERQRQFQRDADRNRQVHRSQPAVNVERQRQFQRDADRNRQMHRSQPAVNVERQRQFQRDADRNRQVHRSQPAVNVERQRQIQRNQIQSQQRQPRQLGTNIERRMPQTYQRAPFSSQDRGSRQVIRDGGRPRQDSMRQGQGRFDGRQRGR